VSNHISTLKRAVNQAIASDGGLAVFQYYGFAPSRRPQKTNPFRQERTSSFFVIEKFGKILFKDFGDDTFKGDCRKFVQLYENLDNEQVWQILAQIYGIGDFQISDFGFKKAKIQTPKKTDLPPSEKKLIEIKFKEFSAEELDFWWKKGFIDLKTLQNNQVQSVLSFKLQIEEGKIREFQNLSFVFAYEIVPNEAYKLYMPKPAYRVYAQAKTVFLPNLEPARAKFGENYAYSFGLQTLDNQQPIILCGGEPDCLALKSAGYNAFTLGDERASIPEFVLKSLKASPQPPPKEGELIPPSPSGRGGVGLYSPSFGGGWGEACGGRLSVLYDTDFTGLKNSYLLAKKYHCQRFVLPKLKKQTSRYAEKPDKNDLCDYLNLCGWDADLQLILKQQIVQHQEFTIQNTPCFSVNKYLSEKTEILTKFIQKYKRVQADADAGVGKTYTMLVEIPQKLHKPMLFVVPFAIQVEQIEQEYTDKVSELVCFTNRSTQLAEDEEVSLIGRPIGQVNVCTFDRIKPVYERLKQDFGDDIVVVVDESHLLTSEYAYRARAIQSVLEICQQAQKVVYLSATPDYALCQFSGFKLIRFKREENPQIHIQPIDYVGEPKKALLSLLLNLSPKASLQPPPKEGEGWGEASGITIIRLNNKTLARVIARMLISQGIYQANEIDFVFSEKRKGISTLAKESIVNQSIIPENVKLLFVTACFDCGINIQNTNIQQIISFETRYTDNCTDTFKQFVARFRNLLNIRVLVCKPEKLRHLPALKSRTDLYQRLAKDGENKLALLAYNDLPYQNQLNRQLADLQYFGLLTPKTPRYIKTNSDISATFKLLVQNPDRQTYRVNYNYIRFVLKDYERKGINSNNFYNNLITELPNTFLFNPITLKVDKKDDNSLLLKDLLQKEKIQKEIRVQEICEKMQQDPQKFFDSVHAEYRDISLKEQIKRQFAVSSVKLAPKLESLFVADIPTPALPAKGAEGEITPSPSEGGWGGASGRLSDYDEEITELSHRYFYLNDLLVPRTKIPELLKNNADDVNFGILTKTLINHINLYVKRKTGAETNLLITDRRKLDDVHWLELLAQEVQNWQPKIYEQKKTPQLKAQLQNLEYDLKLLCYEKRNLNFVAFDYVLKIKKGEKLKAKLRLVKRKLRSLQNQINRLQTDIQSVKQKYENSIIRGFEINELSERINRLRTHTADWQGITANIRLLSSLFEVKNHRRLISLPPTPSEGGGAITPPPSEGVGGRLYEKHIVEIGKMWSFREILQNLKFNEIETQNYIEYLDYQIDIDLTTNRQFWSKNDQNSTGSANHDLFIKGGAGEIRTNPDFLADYPQFWD
jgi:hypothetical protein